MEIVQEKKSVKISELSAILSVSEMTVHRDVKPLIDEGAIIKTFGGITLKEPAEQTAQDAACSYCQGPINKRLAYQFILANHTMEYACCAHCGLLRHRQLQSRDVQAICFDFLKQTTINSSQASYVMNTSIDMGCCKPQVLTFEQESDAKKFVKGFGGDVYSFNEASNIVFDQMNK